MSSQSPENPPQIPLGLTPPVVIDSTMQQHDFFNGPSVFRMRDKEMKGRARLFLDVLPIPEIRFEFEPEMPLSMKESFVDPPFGEGNLEAGPMLGSVNIVVTHTGKVLTGDVNDQSRCHQLSISSARFIVINGNSKASSPVRGGMSELRHHFEVGAGNIVYATLRALSESSDLDAAILPNAMRTLGINASSIDPSVA